jgi:hypothetical protein
VSRVDVLALVVGHLAIHPCRLHTSAAGGGVQCMMKYAPLPQAKRTP